MIADHGFAQFRRGVNLNRWLVNHGYMVLADDPCKRGGDGRRSLDDLFEDSSQALEDVDWSRTKAYAAGINGLYLNVAGRERDGIVPPNERETLLEEIAAKLEAEIDPWTGEPAVARVFLREETFSNGDRREIGPDAVMGYAKGTGGGNESALGLVGPEILTDNEDAWSGDHRMDPPSVPGILATSRPLKRPAANLKELHYSVLAEFGIDPGAGS